MLIHQGDSDIDISNPVSSPQDGTKKHRTSVQISESAVALSLVAADASLHRIRGHHIDLSERHLRLRRAVQGNRAAICGSTLDRYIGSHPPGMGGARDQRMGMQDHHTRRPPLAARREPFPRLPVLSRHPYDRLDSLPMVAERQIDLGERGFARRHLRSLGGGPLAEAFGSQGSMA